MCRVIPLTLKVKRDGSGGVVLTTPCFPSYLQHFIDAGGINAVILVGVLNDLARNAFEEKGFETEFQFEMHNESDCCDIFAIPACDRLPLEEEARVPNYIVEEIKNGESVRIHAVVGETVAYDGTSDTTDKIIQSLDKKIASHLQACA